MRSALRRERCVSVHLEDPIMDLLVEEASREDTTHSTFMRKLLLNYLVKSGKLEAEDMLELLTA